MSNKEAKKKNPYFAPVVLAILDGWGIAPKGPGNMIEFAQKPFWDHMMQRYPHTELQAHGRYVGLLPDQKGNSEAGHMNIGAGRIVRQDVVTVSEAIKDHTFFKNTAFKDALSHAKQHGSKVHIMGLLSNGNSAHAAPEHLFALLKLVHDDGLHRVCVHLFTDGRDSPPFSAKRLLHNVENHLYPNQHIVSIVGRFYAMDRNKLWQRTELAYNAIVGGEGLASPNAHAAILRAYNRGESDEFILPTVIVDEQKRPLGTVEDNDVIIFFNLRSDRARQITKSFVQKDFEQKNEHPFHRKKTPQNIRFATMTEFGPDLSGVCTAFPSSEIQHGLTETLAPFRQFYIAESEKFAHVTYFFNGGYAASRFNEERMRVPSQFVPHHDSKPEMRAHAITNEVVRRLHADMHDFIVINFANVDMIGHTGNLKATVKAVEHVDSCLETLTSAVLAKKGTLVIVGDHGNAEVKIDKETGGLLTEHSASNVPFVVVNDHLKSSEIGDGILADVAPTILDIMDIPKPLEMTGFTLLRT